MYVQCYCYLRGIIHDKWSKKMVITQYSTSMTVNFYICFLLFKRFLLLLFFALNVSKICLVLKLPRNEALVHSASLLFIQVKNCVRGMGSMTS